MEIQEALCYLSLPSLKKNCKFKQILPLVMNEYQNQRKIEPPIEFLILIGIWVACFVVGGVAAIPIWIGMTGKSILTMQADMMNPAYVNALKVIQVVSTIIIFFIPAFITARIASSTPFSRLGFKSGVKLNRAAVAILLMLCALPLVGFLAEVNKVIPVTDAMRKIFDTMESQYAEQVKLMATFKTPVDYILAIFIIALIPALVEEIFFRGAMQSIFMKWFKIPWLVILITSFIFSAIHFSWYGFIPRMALGMVLGYIFFYTGNLWYSVLGHFFNNALSISVLYWQYTKDKKMNMEVGESAPWWAGVLSIVILIALFYLLKKIAATKIHNDSIATSSSHNLYS